MKVNHEVEITDIRMKDLLCCAMEGGSDYWCRIVGYVNPNKVEVEYKHLDLPFIEGCGVLVQDREDASSEKVLINRDRLEKSIKLMAEKYPQHFNDFINENEDADTGDVFLQLATYEDIVFG
jgi:hypothetical protein